MLSERSFVSDIDQLQRKHARETASINASDDVLTPRRDVVGHSWKDVPDEHFDANAFIIVRIS